MISRFKEMIVPPTGGLPRTSRQERPRVAGAHAFGAYGGKEGKEPWDEAWRVKDATTPHLLRNIPRRCGPEGPYAHPCVLAVEVEVIVGPNPLIPPTDYIVKV